MGEDVSTKHDAHDAHAEYEEAISTITDDKVESTPERRGSEVNIEVKVEAEAYSVFSRSQRFYVVLLGTIAAFFSPLSGTTYLPALTPVQQELGITKTEVNLSLTTYLIFQAIAPTLTGELSDTLGRRPVYIITFGIYIVACVGLAVQKSLAALLVLRMLQSTGSSGTIAIGFGGIADLVTSSERGTYIGAVSTLPLSGPALGPVIGGVIAQNAGWRWIFWFLAIFAGVTLTAIVLSFPETNRTVVGNGKIRAPVWDRPLLEKLVCPAASFPSADATEGNDPTKAKKKIRVREVIPNPFKSVLIAWNKDVGIILFVMSVYFASYYAIAASVPQLFEEIYGYNEQQIGFCYIALGTGGIVSSLLSGKLVDRDFRVTAQREGIEVDRKKLEDMAKFPIEKARLRTIWYMMAVGTGGMISYGWALNTRPSVAVPLVLHFIVGGAVTSVMNIVSVFLMDLYPASPATATASGNLCRCMLGAVATSVIDLMLNKLGLGWTFTFWGLLCAACFPLLEMERRWGKGWRMERFEALMKKKKAEEDLQKEQLEESKV